MLSLLYLLFSLLLQNDIRQSSITQVSSTMSMSRFARDQDVKFKRPVKNEQDFEAIFHEVAGDLMQNGPGTVPRVVSSPPVLSER